MSGSTTAISDNGAILYAYSRNPSPSPIVLFSATITVPPAPIISENQFIDLWIGLQPDDSSYVIQSVLQYTGSENTPGGIWRISGVFAVGPTTVGQSAWVTVAPGTILTAVVSCTGATGSAYNYQASFTGYSQTVLNATGQQLATYALVELEAFNMHRCGNYPLGQFPFANIVTNIGTPGTSGTYAAPTWVSNALFTDCGLQITIGSPGYIALGSSFQVPSISSAPSFPAPSFPAIPSGTAISGLTGAQFATRIADLYPRDWCSDTAKQPGGNVYALLLAVGNELSIVQTELEYALNAQRIQTETFPELDFASIDLLGETLPRLPGASDAAFSQAIIAALFQPAATRPALQNALTKLTGSVPRLMEPWSVNDTGAWKNFSYWNVDTVSNPARWGDGGLRYQGFIETAPPSIPAIGPNNPIQCWDTAYWNVPGYLFGILAPVDINAVDDLVNRLRAYGTEVWLKIVTPKALGTIVAPTAVINLTATPTGTSSVLVAWHNPTIGTPPFSFLVQYQQLGQTTFTAGPSVSVNSAVISNLAANTSYNFSVLAQNSAGGVNSGVVSATTAAVPPSPATNLVAELVQANAITLGWSPPITGSPPFVYSVNYRITGTTIWQNIIVGQGALAVTIINLVPNTSYDLEVISTN